MNIMINRYLLRTFLEWYRFEWKFFWIRLFEMFNDYLRGIEIIFFKRQRWLLQQENISKKCIFKFFMIWLKGSFEKFRLFCFSSMLLYYYLLYLNFYNGSKLHLFTFLFEFRTSAYLKTNVQICVGLKHVELENTMNGFQKKCSCIKHSSLNL